MSAVLTEGKQHSVNSIQLPANYYYRLLIQSHLADVVSTTPAQLPGTELSATTLDRHVNVTVQFEKTDADIVVSVPLFTVCQ